MFSDLVYDLISLEVLKQLLNNFPSKELTSPVQIITIKENELRTLCSLYYFEKRQEIYFFGIILIGVNPFHRIL